MSFHNHLILKEIRVKIENFTDLVICPFICYNYINTVDLFNIVLMSKVGAIFLGGL